MAKEAKHKAGFVNLIGLPNVGKSSLINALTGEKLSIVSPRAQTTRHRIRNILSGSDFQIIFCDNPGLVHQPVYELHHRMNRMVHEAYTDSDILIFVTDRFQNREQEENFEAVIQGARVPVLIVINKVDVTEAPDLQNIVARYRQKFPSAEVFTTSAVGMSGIKDLLKRIHQLLPESPAYFEKDALTDHAQRFFVSEIVREKIFLNFKEEIPYSTQVEVAWYKEGDTLDRIKCIIYTERESQKKILIGAGGSAIKRVGVEARKDIEKLVGKQVYLELMIKVKEGWRNDEKSLRSFGYIANE